jgi:hypothetical protein
MLILFLLILAAYCVSELNRTLRLRFKVRRLLAPFDRTEALCDDFLARVPEPENGYGRSVARLF